MSIFKCNDLANVVSSQPSIPVILKGKKRQHNKSQLIQPSSQSPHQPFIIRQSNIMLQPQPIIRTIQFSANNPRSTSVPRKLIIHQPISQEQLIRNQNNVHMGQQIKPPQIPKLAPNCISGDQIRRTIDQKLQKAYGQIRQRRNSPTIQNYSNIKNIELNKIKIEEQLVQQYIKLIYKDYSIRDPLGYDEPNYQKQNSYPYKGRFMNYIQQSIDTQPNRRPTKRRGSTMMSGSTNKKAVQLKQSFLIEMFSPVDQSSINHSNDRNQTKSNDYSNSISRKKLAHTAQNSVPNPFVHSQNLTQIAQVNEKQVIQAYRFCFICEQPILQANIDIHQREKCPQFCHLYNMNLEQIRDLLIKKIVRIKSQTQDLYISVFQDEINMKQKISSLKKEARKYLGTIDSNIKLDSKNKIKVVPTPIWKNELKDNFSHVMRSYEENYFKLYENMRKLQWFILMLKNLQEKYYEQSKKQPQSKQIKMTQRQYQQFNRRFSLAK